ncbi:MAG TPA: hypothetical protein VHO27_16750, partial [Angustibacter sp.]|nr:hypothetical protein [Angustibacter sp.]
LSSNASVDDIKAKTEALATVSQEIGQAMYQAEQASAAAGESAGAPTGEAGSASSDDDVVDAEVVDDEPEGRAQA